MDAERTQLDARGNQRRIGVRQSPLPPYPSRENTMKTDACFSDDRNYRWWLLRVWDDSLPINCSCGVNPSTADERENDPTIRKDIGFSERQGFGGLLKVNLSAFRSTDPKPARKHGIGEFNTSEYIRIYFDRFNAKQFTACWGRNGSHFHIQARSLLREFPEAMCFGKNPDGTPRHTLMLPYITPLQPVDADFARKRVAQ